MARWLLKSEQSRAVSIELMIEERTFFGTAEGGHKKQGI